MKKYTVYELTEMNIKMLCFSKSDNAEWYGEKAVTQFDTVNECNKFIQSHPVTFTNNPAWSF